MDWEGKIYDYLLTYKKYEVRWRQKWVDYKKWIDFGRNWTPASEKYYTEEEMLKEILEPCYKFLWVKLYSKDIIIIPFEPPVSGWLWQCDKVKYVGYVDLVNLSDIEYIDHGMFFSPDGTNLYVSGFLGRGNIFWFKLATPWDITTAIFQNTMNEDALGAILGRPKSIYFSPDGNNYYTSVLKEDGTFFSQITLTNPWDITTMYTHNGVRLNWFVYNINFNLDGTKLYLFGHDTFQYILVEYTLSTPWDISTIVNLDGDVSLHLNEVPPDEVIDSLYFKPDGSGFYVATYSGDVLYYDLPTPWSLSDYIYKGICFNPKSILNAIDIYPYGGTFNFFMSYNGKFAYVSFELGTQIFMFTSGT